MYNKSRCHHYNVLQSVVRENDVDDVIDSTFEVEYDWFGKVRKHELKHNGREIPVTNTNKDEYVKWENGVVVGMW